MKTMGLISLLSAGLSTAVAQSEYQPVDVRSLHDKISVRMHQANRFTFDQRGDRLLNPRPVRRAQKEPSVMLQLTNEIGGGVSGVNFLVLSSTYPQMLRCRGAARFRGKAGFVTTGVYTVHRKDPTAASFHDPIQEFIIWDIRLTNERG
jgi:hypothetical protein